MSNKCSVVSLLERGGEVRSFHVDKAKTRIREILVRNVDLKSNLMTDESRLYAGSGEEINRHQKATMLRANMSAIIAAS